MCYLIIPTVCNATVVIPVWNLLLSSVRIRVQKNLNMLCKVHENIIPLYLFVLRVNSPMTTEHWGRVSQLQGLFSRELLKEPLSVVKYCPV